MSNGPKWALSSNLNKKQYNLYRCPSKSIFMWNFPLWGLPPVAHRSLSSYQIMAVSTQIYSPASLRLGSWSVFVLLHYSRLGAAIRLHLLLLSRLTNLGFPQTRLPNIKKWNYWKVKTEVFSWSPVQICHSLSGAFSLSNESLCFLNLIEFWLVTSVRLSFVCNMRIKTSLWKQVCNLY